MSGLMMLVPMVALSADPTWQAGPGGQLYYTIEIEEKYLSPLREGQAVAIPVEEKDRGLRRFQVYLGRRTALPAGAAPGQNGTMVSYGWRPNEAGGLDYMIQISPERLETLATGTPVIDEVVPEVTDIRRIYIFAGVGELPREAPANSSSTVPLSGPAAGPNRNPAGTGSLGNGANAGSRFGNFDPGERTRQPLSNIGAAAAGGGSRFEGNLNNTRPLGNGGALNSLASGSLAGSREAVPSRFATQTTGSETGQLGARFGGGSTDVHRLNSQQPAIGADYTVAQAAQEAAAQRLAAQQVAAEKATAELAEAKKAVDLQTAALKSMAQNPQLLMQQLAGQGVAGLTTQQAQLPVGFAQAPPQTQQAGQDKGEEPVKPWTPLILTSLALFASIGGNAYLGWLAWSFYWRYRDAASDIVRARDAVTSRQAA